MARPQPTTNCRSVVAAIPEHAVWPLPRSAPFAVQRRNRIDQRQGLLSRFDSRRSDARRAARLARCKADGACLYVGADEVATDGAADGHWYAHPRERQAPCPVT